MHDTILKLLLEHLPLVLAAPLLFVGSALALSLFGKLKAWFDEVLTIENTVYSGPHIVRIIVAAHIVLTLASAAIGYYGTDLFSPPVDPNAMRQDDRKFMRRYDWLIVGRLAVLYIVVAMLLWLNVDRLRRAATVFGAAIVPTACLILAFATVNPSAITPNPTPPSIWTSTGFLWWYAEVAFMSPLLGTAFLIVWWLRRSAL